VVIPLYDEEDSLRELHQQLRSSLDRMRVRYELIFVDDGSTDRSFQVLRDMKRNDHRIKIIRFRRNFGKSAALAVGFSKAQGNIIVTLDADLQDDPAEIPALTRRIHEGYDLVSGWKKKRFDPITKTIPSRFFNFVTSVMTGIHLHDFNCGLKAYRKAVVKNVRVYGELHRYVPVLAHWEGFKVGEIVVQHRPRKYGKTKFGIGRFWKGFLDLLTVLFTTRYFRRPLHLFGFWGLMSVLAGVVIDVWLVAEWFLGQTSLSNRPLFLGGILLIIVGIQIVSIGLLGEMISKARQTEEEYAIRDFIR
jgi:glycosyltransferase involved in cell wall biosynthesis